jgi:hypothetical protein
MDDETLNLSIRKFLKLRLAVAFDGDIKLG